MVIYVIIFLIAVCLGMAISVYSFGTGSKRAKIFKEIYFSIEDIDGIGVLYTKTGEFSAILTMQNPVQKFCADINEYNSFSNLLSSLMSTLGEGYSIHKQDVFTKKKFQCTDEGNKEFLSESYFKYFKGREYTDCSTYIVITQENKKSRLFSYDDKKWKDFLVKVGKVRDQLRDRGVSSRFLSASEAKLYVDQYLSQNYTSKNVSLNNFNVKDDQIGIGDRKFKVYSLVDVDSIVLPTLIRPYTNIEVNNISMPVDLMSMVDSIPEAKSVVFNQVIFLPSQKQEMSRLAKKKNQSDCRRGHQEGRRADSKRKQAACILSLQPCGHCRCKSGSSKMHQSSGEHLRTYRHSDKSKSLQPIGAVRQHFPWQQLFAEQGL